MAIGAMVQAKEPRRMPALELRVIKGFPKYSASPDGRIWRTSPVKSNRFKGRELPYEVAQKTTKSGYKEVGMEYGYEGIRKTVRVQRIIALTYIGPPPFDGAEVAHKDGDKNNNSADNLRWCSHLENIQDKYKHGTMPLGEDHPMAKLCENDVQKIREMSEGGLTIRDISSVFNVHTSTIARILNGKKWKKVRSDGPRAAKKGGRGDLRSAVAD